MGKKSFSGENSVFVYVLCLFPSLFWSCVISLHRIPPSDMESTAKSLISQLRVIFCARMINSHLTIRACAAELTYGQLFRWLMKYALGRLPPLRTNLLADWVLLWSRMCSSRLPRLRGQQVHIPCVRKPLPRPPPSICCPSDQLLVCSEASVIA